MQYVSKFRQIEAIQHRPWGDIVTTDATITWLKNHGIRFVFLGDSIKIIQGHGFAYAQPGLWLVYEDGKITVVDDAEFQRSFRPTVPDSKGEKLVTFCHEAAGYFAKRWTGGEDAAHWANVANSETMLKIAEVLEAMKDYFEYLDSWRTKQAAANREYSTYYKGCMQRVNKLRAMLGFGG